MGCSQSKQAKDGQAVILKDKEIGVKDGKAEIVKMPATTGKDVDNKKNVKDMVGSIDKKVATANGAIDKKGAELNGSIDKKAGDLNGSIDKKAGNLNGAIDKKATDISGSVDKKTGSMEKKTGDLSASIDKTTGDLSGSVDQKTGTLASAVDKKAGDLSALSAEKKASDASGQSTEKKIGDLSGSLDKKIDSLSTSQKTASLNTSQKSGALFGSVDKKAGELATLGSEKKTMIVSGDTVLSGTSGVGMNKQDQLNPISTSISPLQSHIASVPAAATDLKASVIATSVAQVPIATAPSLATSGKASTTTPTGVTTSHLLGVPAVAADLKATAASVTSEVSKPIVIGQPATTVNGSAAANGGSLGSHTDSLLSKGSEKKADLSSAISASASSVPSKVFGVEDKKDDASKTAAEHDQAAFEKKMLNVINNTLPEKKDVMAGESAQSGVVTNPLSMSINSTSIKDTAASGIPRATSGIPQAVSTAGTTVGALGDSVIKKPESPQSTSTTFTPRLDAAPVVLVGGAKPDVPTLATLEKSAKASLPPLPQSAQKDSGLPPVPPTQPGAAGGDPPKSVKEMIGNIAKRKSSIPVSDSMSRSNSRQSMTPPSKPLPTVVLGGNNSSRSSMSPNPADDSDLRRSGSLDPSKKSPSIPRFGARSESPSTNSGLPKPVVRTMVGNGKWGDGPAPPSEDSRSQRSMSPRDKYERDSDTSSMNGGTDSMYCEKTGRRLGRSPSEKKEVGGSPDENGSVKGVVANWNSQARDSESLVRDTAKSRSHKEATALRELSPGKVTLVDKRCTF